VSGDRWHVLEPVAGALALGSRFAVQEGFAMTPKYKIDSHNSGCALPEEPWDDDPFDVFLPDDDPYDPVPQVGDFWGEIDDDEDQTAATDFDLSDEGEPWHLRRRSHRCCH
jgi:hypothetical protein